MERLRLAGPDETTGVTGTLNFVTVAETQAYIEKPGDSGGAFDTLIQTLIDSASQGVFGLTGGRFIKRSTTEFDFVMTPDTVETILLHQYPVGAISLIEFGTMESNGVWALSWTPAASDWYADLRAGKIHGYWPSGKHSIRVKWTGGFASTAIPADIKEAVFQWVGVKLSRLRKARWDASSMQGATEGWTFTDELPPSAAATIAKYSIPEASMA